MPYGLSLHGGKKRFAYSKSTGTGALATWGAVQTIDRVICYTNASPAVGPAAYEALLNAGACEGQDHAPTRIVKGAHKKLVSPEYWCTPEAWGRFISSLTGSDAHSTVDTSAHKHLFVPTQEPLPFTLQDHQNGFEDLDFANHYSGVWVNKTTLKITKGGQYATLSPELVLSKHNWDNAVTYPVDGLEAYDVAGTLPNVPGMAPGKFRLVASKTDTTGPHGSRFTTLTWPSPTTQGRPPDHNLAGSAIEVGLYCDDITLEILTGVVIEDTQRAGFSSGAGDKYGKPYALAPSCRLTLAMDVRDSSFAQAMAAFFRDIDRAGTDASGSYTFQLLGTGDTLVGATFYETIGWVAHAMYLEAPAEPSAGVDTQKTTLTFVTMQAASAAPIWEAVSIDDMGDYVS